MCMRCDEPLLGPYLSKLPVELLLDISLTLCISSQRDYAALVLVSRTLRDVCRLSCLPVVPVVLETPDKTTQFANYLAADKVVAPLIRRLWIVQDSRGIIPKCTNLVALACDGRDLVHITSCGTFQHTQLVDLTIMGLWNFWSQFLRTKHARVLCSQLEKMWLLDHLFLHGIDLGWLSSLKMLIYWSIELRGSQKQFKKELGLLKALPELRKLQLLMLSPSDSTLSRLGDIGDPRLEVVSWGKRNEKVEWASQGMVNISGLLLRCVFQGSSLQRFGFEC